MRTRDRLLRNWSAGCRHSPWLSSRRRCRSVKRPVGSFYTRTPVVIIWSRSVNRGRCSRRSRCRWLEDVVPVAVYPVIVIVRSADVVTVVVIIPDRPVVIPVIWPVDIVIVIPVRSVVTIIVIADHSSRGIRPVEGIPVIIPIAESTAPSCRLA